MTRVSPAKPSKARAVAPVRRGCVAPGTPSVPRITYRRDEAAEALGVSTQTVDAWIAAGVLRASKPPGVSGQPGRYILIRAADIEAMLLASAVAP